MTEVDVIPERVQTAIRAAGAADILIALPTFNNEETIARVIRAARAALHQFPNSKKVIVHVDGGSSDATVARARDSFDDALPFFQLSYPVYTLHKLEVSHHSVPGKESAYRTIFHLAEEIGAKACCVVAADAAVLTPDWIASLVRPVLEMGFDVAAPFYQRHMYEGLLVNGMLYPFIRALFGKRIRQPIGSDFAYSQSLVRRCMELKAWNTEAARRDIDLWLNVLAVQSDMKVCQVHLGARPRVTKDEPFDLSSVVASVAGAMYIQMEQSAETWQRIRGSVPLPAFGLRFDPETEAPPVDVNPMIEAFRIGCQNLQEIWSLILPPASLLELKRMSRQQESGFSYPDGIWVRTIYDFAVAHRLRTIGRDHLLRALTPLYLGWVASFIRTVKEMNPRQAEDQIEKLCAVFESEKSHLISRWRWPDRFMP